MSKSDLKVIQYAVGRLFSLALQCSKMEKNSTITNVCLLAITAKVNININIVKNEVVPKRPVPGGEQSSIRKLNFFSDFRPLCCCCDDRNLKSSRLFPMN